MHKQLTGTNIARPGTEALSGRKGERVVAAELVNHSLKSVGRAGEPLVSYPPSNTMLKAFTPTEQVEQLLVPAPRLMLQIWLAELRWPPIIDNFPFSLKSLLPSTFCRSLQLPHYGEMNRFISCKITLVQLNSLRAILGRILEKGRFLFGHFKIVIVVRSWEFLINFFLKSINLHFSENRRVWSVGLFFNFFLNCF